MENICWFCEKNNAEDNLEYEVNLKRHDNRKDKTKVDIPRCSECADNHKKGDVFSLLIYLVVVAIIAVAIFVIKLDLIYIAIGYILIIRPLSNLSIKIRNKVSEPNKSVCIVSENPEVVEKIEEGYIETRRF